MNCSNAIKTRRFLQEIVVFVVFCSSRKKCSRFPQANDALGMDFDIDLSPWSADTGSTHTGNTMNTLFLIIKTKIGHVKRMTYVTELEP